MTTSVIVDQASARVVDHATTRVVVSGMIGPSPTTTLTGLSDIDITHLEAGSLLVYNANTQKWTATNTLEQGQGIEPGQY